MSAHGHKHTGSVTQNHKAQLANAYNELGKELSSSKIRVVGNYTLGKVIGEGVASDYLVLSFLSLTHTRRVWEGSLGHSPYHLHQGRHKANSKGNVRLSYPRNTPPPSAPPPPCHSDV